MFDIVNFISMSRVMNVFDILPLHVNNVCYWALYRIVAPRGLFVGETFAEIGQQGIH